MNWSESEIETLKSLWSQTLTARDIGARLGRDRNSIIGKAHRLNLEGRKVEERTTPRPWVPRKRKSSPPSVPKPKREAVYGRKRGGTSYSVLASARARAKPIEAPPQPRGDKPTLMQLRAGECKWPFGDPRHASFHFCGASTGAVEHPYCSAHAREAYQPLQTRPAWR